nr:hypothetical protein [Planctomycetota bacterium]
MLRRIVPALVIACLGAPAFAADALITRLDTIPIHFKAKDLSRVAEAQLWVTTDDGATWGKQLSEKVTPGTGGPTFRFQAQRDGRYGFATRAVYKDGSSDAEPQAGQPPKANHVVLIDRSDPVIEAFSVTPDATDPLRVSVTWRVSDANPADKGVQFMMAPHDSESWIPFGGKQAPNGEWAVAFPRESHRLRMDVRDRAGNRSVSEVWAAPAPAASTAAATPA